ncbi:hypothetical protein K2173_021632 [Erythroxylum novogranatense]|uniref:Molybdenum cofactor sulfurase n=1 Tax=Erythroxylum novogranatense TaxID=1862640 RepID=A0AAV8TIP0_9ROSI|nr:hypothetical protein K2173_021632 [Erythroxylum novogranatense]
MLSTLTKSDSETCKCQGCCPTPFLGLSVAQTPNPVTSAALSRYSFEVAMVSSVFKNCPFTNHESLPSLRQSYFDLINVFPQYAHTEQVDRIREHEYPHLSRYGHVCLDYIGHGLFSYSQQHVHIQPESVASMSTTSTPPLPPPHSAATEPPFFDISYKAVSLYYQLQYGGQESELEHKLQRRIMAFMNVSEDDYTMVFTANQSSAFKLLADNYPFQTNRNLVTVYDHKDEAVEMMIRTSTKKGARATSAEFLWPSLDINSAKFLKKVVSKKKKKKRGLFVFPVQSKMIGTRYSYLWMSIAQENGWHVLLDACALGAKHMETLGLSLFKPDFLVCSFYKVFGDNPSGFGCLFVKKSSASIFSDLSTSTSMGIVKIVPAKRPYQHSEDWSSASIETQSIVELHSDGIVQESCSLPTSSGQHEIDKTHEKTEHNAEQKASKIDSLGKSSEIFEKCTNETLELECGGLNQADSIGLITITARARVLINWLVNGLMKLQHPNSENGLPLVRLCGPKVKFYRGPAVSFNVFDWKGEKIDTLLVQKLAERNNISLGCGFLENIRFSDKNEEERVYASETRTSEKRVKGSNTKRDEPHCGISVVTATVGLLTNFEDVYRLWAFVSRFLDADFVEKEKWRYSALNQEIFEI